MHKTAILFSLLLFFGCVKEVEIVTETPRFPTLMEIPQGFPEMQHPEGNEFTRERWELGKKLFFDPVLSADSSISCASCHESSLGFSDNKSVSLGVEDRPGRRNSSPLANVGYHPYFTREGAVPTLEMQVLVPIQEHDEFDFNIVLIAERLAEIEEYVEMSRSTYDREPDAFVITRALSCFERSLISGNSRYDQYFFQEKTDALSEEELRGMDLFFSERTGCSNCHEGFNFSDYSFQNNGIYAEYADEGKFRLTGEEADRGLFKVPSLRNIELTGPYMHDGSMETLEEIISHYNSGGKGFINQSEKVRFLALTTNEKADLVTFLKSLTDDTFVNNPIFKE
ncbi:MAG: cytochrome c peroxidase [Saprospiraceae bacterium]|jgi:cytochrome c peroxidase